MPILIVTGFRCSPSGVKSATFRALARNCAVPAFFALSVRYCSLTYYAPAHARGVVPCSKKVDANSDAKTFTVVFYGSKF